MTTDAIAGRCAESSPGAWSRFADSKDSPELVSSVAASISVSLKPSQDKILTGGGDLHEAQVDAPCLLAIPAFDRIAGLYNRYLNSNKGM